MSKHPLHLENRVSPEVMGFLYEKIEEGDKGPTAISRAIMAEFGVFVHPDTIWRRAKRGWATATATPPKKRRSLTVVEPIPESERPRRPKLHFTDAQQYCLVAVTQLQRVIPRPDAIPFLQKVRDVVDDLIRRCENA